MRGSKAKKFRNQARELSKGMPERGYIDIKHRVIVGGKAFIGVQLVSHPKTTRGIYRRLKKGLAA